MFTGGRATMRPRSTPRNIELDNNRIDLVFEIREGPETKVVGINFIGNQAFSDTEFVVLLQRPS